MGLGGGGSSSTTTESSPWGPTQDYGKDIMDWAKQLTLQQLRNPELMPRMEQGQLNSNLLNAWQSMGETSKFNNMAGQLGQQGSAMLEQLGNLSGIYEELGKGTNRYNITAGRDAYLADKQSFLDDQNAATMDALNEAIATSTGQIYGNAAGGGNVGSSRTQLSVGQASGNLASQANAQMADRMSQAYDQAMSQSMSEEQMRLQGLQAQASGIAQMGQMGANMLGQAGNIYQQGLQNQLNAGLGQLQFEQQNNLINYQNRLNAYNQPMNSIGWFNSAVLPWAGTGGTSTSTGPGPDRMGQIIGAGGAILGGLAGSGFFN